MAKKGENIYKRKDGRWEGRYIKGRDPNGRPRYGYVYGYKYKDIRTRLLLLKSQCVDTQVIGPDFKGTLGEWAKRYLEEMVRARVKSSTYAYYQGMLKTHILPAFGDTKLTTITQADVQAFAWFLESKKLSEKTQRAVIEMLGRVMKAAVRKKVLRVNPCEELALPARQTMEIMPLNLEEQKRLEEAALADKDGLAVMLALYTGMRIGEICALCWEDIDFAAGTLYVHRTIQRIINPPDKDSKTTVTFGTAKSVHSNRSVPLTAKLASLLEAEKTKSDSEYVVSCRGNFAEPRIVRYRYERILKRSGIRPIHFHGLRHTFATRCLETGMDVASLSRILGHGSVKMTLDIYAGATMEHKAASIQKLDRIFDKGSMRIAT